MRLTKLEINGFKSFARKTEIRFGDGITAIIGPNGSGKSNIADAVRWVLGEQSAKALRGSKMEDVIFNGTQLRKAQAYCEVTLTFDNADGKLAAPYAEVAVTRRVYRSGESEYCINKTACRLRDVQELFRDTGIGKEGYSIIGQGRVDEILANKSGDRRAALEEAAGVMRYRVRKEEAERKLDNTEKNLVRIEDIIDELFSRIAPLEEQSASARAFLKLRDELKDLEINLFLYQYDKAGDRLAAAREAIEQMKTESEASETEQTKLLEHCAALEEQSRVLDAALSERHGQLMRMMAAVETRLGGSRVLFERRAHAVETRERLLAEQERAGARLGELEQTLAEMQREHAGEAALTHIDGELSAAEQTLSSIDAELASREKALEEMKNSIIEAMNRMSDLRSSASRFDAMRAALNERMTLLLSEAERQKNETARLAAEHESAKARQSEHAAALTKAKNALAASLLQREEQTKAYAALREAEQRDEQAISAMQSRLRVLDEMAKSREGYYASIKNVLKDCPRDSRLKSAIVGVVAELIDVPQTYETAISMALASSLQNIVTLTAEDAQYVIEYLRAHDYGRATLLPIALLHPSHLSREERSFLSAEGCVGVASELVACDESVRTAIDYLLCRTVIVRDLDAGVALKKRSRGAFHIATLAGDIISTGGSMSGGSVKKGGYSLLGREREMQELRARIGKSERALLEKKEALTQYERTLLQCDVQSDAFRNEVHACEVEAAKQQEQLDIILRDEQNSLARETAFAEEKAQIEENLTDIEKQREETRLRQTDATRGSEAGREDVLRAQSELASRRQAREIAASAVTDLKVRRMALIKERDAVAAEQKRVASEHRALSERVLALSREAEENEKAISQLEQQAAEAEQAAADEQKLTDEEKQAQEKLENERQSISDALNEARARREELLSSSRELSERIHKQELSVSRMEMELAAWQDHVWEEYELTYENALPYRHEIGVGAANARITEIKNEVRALGEVNLAAIEDYKAVSERHASLNAQRDDLRKAKTDLETLIVDLTETMQKTFLAKFAEIQKNFAEVFVELFGGGMAELRLADKTDVLSCEIDIIAQPPGKKLQLLSLLSGGERAMTAIALLFALLKLKPPAFCLLDEIESSLDEANVTRFAEYVRNYREDTQFILITHRKGSMEVCNVLYGVSMEEKGISKVVSARFGEGA